MADTNVEKPLSERISELISGETHRLTQEIQRLRAEIFSTNELSTNYKQVAQRHQAVTDEVKADLSRTQEKLLRTEAEIIQKDAIIADRRSQLSALEAKYQNYVPNVVPAEAVSSLASIAREAAQIRTLIPQSDGSPKKDALISLLEKLLEELNAVKVSFFDMLRGRIAAS